MGFNVTQVERMKTILEVRDLIDEGKSETQVAKTLGLDIRTVKRHRKYIDALKIADLSNDEIAEKRQELFLDLCSAETEAKKLFSLYKDPKICKLCNGEGIVLSKKGKDGEEDVYTTCKHCRGFGFNLNTLDANRFLKSWLEIIDKKIGLYGLDNMKPDTIVNQQFNGYVPQDKIPTNVAEMISKKLISAHESKVKAKYEQSLSDYS